MTSRMTAIAILGGGKLAGATSTLLAHAGQRVRVWARQPGAAARLARDVPNAEVAPSIEEAARGAALIVFAVPTQALPEVAARVGEVATGDQIAVHGCRGLLPATSEAEAPAELRLPHQIIRAETCIKKVGALGGPLHADDAAAGRPLAAVVASRFDEVAAAVRIATQGTRVRVYPTHDIVGVEVAGAVGNVAVLAAGIAAGAGLAETDQGILLTRGLAEASRAGQLLGAQEQTFLGFAGVGDLLPRPVTSMRRHRELGEMIGAGGDVRSLLAGCADLEGPTTARALARFAAHRGVSLPLVAAVDAILEGAPGLPALERVLAMDL